MAALVDTSVLVDVLRGDAAAAAALLAARRAGLLHASEVTRLEILVGMRPREEQATERLLAELVWHPLDADVARRGGELGRRWRRSHSGIDGADLAIAATALLHDLQLLTRNVKHFPMFAGLEAPY